MTSFKILYKASAVVAAGVITLTSCSFSITSTPNDDSPSSVSTTDTTTDDTSESSSVELPNLNSTTASEFVEKFYKQWGDSFDLNTMMEAQEKLSDIVGTDISTLSDVDAEAALSKLSDTQKDQLVSETTKLNNVAEFFDTTGLTQEEVIALNLSSVMFSSMLSSANGKMEVTVDPWNISIIGNEAIIKADALNITYDGEETETSNAGGVGFNLNLVGVNDQWKIDGKKFLDSLSSGL